MGALDNNVVEISCPNCQAKIKKSLRWFKQSGHHCPGCNAVLDTNQIRATVNKIEAELSKLMGSIGKIGR